MIYVKRSKEGPSKNAGAGNKGENERTRDSERVGRLLKKKKKRDAIVWAHSSRLDIGFADVRSVISYRLLGLTLLQGSNPNPRDRPFNVHDNNTKMQLPVDYQ
jgi:hypothetical protein